MEENKENRSSSKYKSRIPVPVIPYHWTSKEAANKTHDSEARIPLGTISTINENVTRRKVNKLRRSKSFSIDTRHVTRRRGNQEQFDWFEVYEENGDAIIYINDDDDNSFAADGKADHPGFSKTSVTPDVKTFSKELFQLKNVKKTLKRPHSRELLGLTPEKEMKKVDLNINRRLFNDKLEDLFKSTNLDSKFYVGYIQWYGCDFLNHLLSRENKWPVPKINTSTRACVFNWLMKINGVQRSPSVVQIAAWYLDLILTQNSVAWEKIQLVAMACYWIALKHYGPVTTSQKLIKYSNKSFTLRELEVAERSILTNLNFPAQAILPQEYITYLSWWCDDKKPGETELAATFFCMTGLMLDVGMCGQLPSVIGVAAVRNALFVLKKQEFLIKLEKCQLYEEVMKRDPNFLETCAQQRRAVRMLLDKDSIYKAPLQLYNVEGTAEKVLFETQCLFYTHKT